MDRAPVEGPQRLNPFIPRSLPDIPPLEMAELTGGIPLWPIAALIGAPLLLLFEFSCSYPWLLRPVVLSVEPAVYCLFIPADATGFYWLLLSI